MGSWMGVEIPEWVLIVVALAFVLLAAWKPSPSQRVSVDGVSGRKKAKLPPEQTPVSAEAVAVAKRFGVSVGKRRVPVTIFVNDVVLRNTSGGDCNWVVIEGASRVVALLNEVACVFLIACVGSDEEEKQVKDLAISTGLVKPSNESPVIAIPEHRLLFCSTHVGQVALVRQLRVSLHVGGSVALMEGLSRFVPELILIDQDAVAPFSDQGGTKGLGGQDANSNGSSSGSSSNNNNRKSPDCLSWREYKCLTAAAGLSGQKPAKTAS